MPASYEERLNCLVVKEEFFPLMDEMKEFISTLTNAGNGIIIFLDLKRLITDLNKVVNPLNP